MKTLASVLFLLVFGVAYAGSDVKIEGGEILVSPSVWTKTGVKITSEAQMYPKAVLEAFQNPGKVITVEEKISLTVVDLFHYRKETTATRGVRYSAIEAMVDVERMDMRVGGEDSFFVYPIFWLIAVAAFFVSGNLNKGIGIVFAVSAAAAAAVSAAAATTVSAVAIGAVAAIAAAAIAAIDDMELSKVFSIFFYMLMIVSAGLVYLPLFL
ncbi:MAG: hypothetical protein AAB819_02185 [Patescibacteria group bacterium]